MAEKSALAMEVAKEIVLIETESAESVLEGTLAADVVMALSEFGAKTLIIESPVLGVSMSNGLRNDELLSLFNVEFDTIEDNIKNLFDGIRMGTVSPRDTSRYVARLVELTGEGKNRLLNASVQNELRGALELDRATLALDTVRIADDLSVEVVSSTGNLSALRRGRQVPLFSKVNPDPDGVLRRIPPLDITGENVIRGEHVVYSVLKNRLGPESLAKDGALKLFGREIDGNLILSIGNTGEAASDAAVLGASGFRRSGLGRSSFGRSFSLDDRHSIILAPLREGTAFKTLKLNDFLLYCEKDRALYKTLSLAQDLAPYGKIQPENFPSFLYEKERATRAKLLETGSTVLRETMRNERDDYFKSLSAFFQDSTETAIEESFNDLLNNERLRPDGKEKLMEIKRELLMNYASGREIYKDLAILRRRLESGLDGSFCILGPPATIGSSALLANTIIGGAYIRPAEDRTVVLLSFAVSLIFVLIVFLAGPFTSIVSGILFAVGINFITRETFLFTAYWIPPITPAISVFFAGLISSICAFFEKKAVRTRYVGSFAPFAPQRYITALQHSKSLDPGEIITSRCAIVAIKNPELSRIQEGPPAQTEGRTLSFYEKTRDTWTRGGAVIVGLSHDTVLAAFGSPIERAAYRSMKNEMPYDDDPLPRGANNPVAKAAGFLVELLKTDDEAAAFCYGLDGGEAAFCWNKLSGYTASGSAALRSRALSALCTQYNVHILVTTTAAKRLEGYLMRPLDSLVSGADGANEGDEQFYELMTR
jgi:hypothetical protein